MKVLSKVLIFERNNLVSFIIFLLAVPTVLLLLHVLHQSDRYIILLVALPVALIFLINFKISFTLLILLLFANSGIYYFSVSEVFVPLVVVSFLVTRTFAINELNNKLNLWFLIFVLSVIPSYYGLEVVNPTVFLFYHLIVFFLLFNIIPLAITEKKHIKHYLFTYLSVSLVNGIFLIIKALLSGKREFGFAGIMFVDYGSLAVLISFLAIVFLPKRRVISVLLFTVLSIALIFTQTRNVWIVLIITLSLLVLYFFKKSDRLNFSRFKLTLIITITLFVVSTSVIAIFTLSPSVSKRVEFKEMEATEEVDRILIQVNSLASRFFIWQTSWEAFKSNPVTGIGLYSFPFQSEKYSTINPIFYEVFVKKLTPHETFIALLAETGVVGFIGFIIFLISVLVYSTRSLSLAQSMEEKFITYSLVWSQIYIALSMIVTDAWLWGHGIVLWGIVLGLNIANKKYLILSKNKKMEIEISSENPTEKNILTQG